MFQRMKLFPKTFMLTFSTMALTILIFAFGFQLSYHHYVNLISNRQFTQGISELKGALGNKYVLNRDVRNVIVKTSRKYGLQIVMFDQEGQMIYPYFMESGAALEVEGSASTIESESDYAMSMVNSNQSETFPLTISGSEFTFMIHSNLIVDKSFTTLLFTNMIPYVVGVGLCVSILVSYLYAKMMSKKFKRLNQVMSKMETLNYSPSHHELMGDEMVDLENQINALYARLVSELNLVKKFEKDREVLMKGTVHELKTPIMVLSLKLQELRIKNDDNISIDQDLMVIENKLNQMSQLVNELLKVATLDSIKNSVEIDLNLVMVEITELYELLLEDKNIVVEYEIESNIMMNLSDLKRVLSNLLSNAIKYAPSNSKILIHMNHKEFKIKNDFKGEVKNDILEPFVMGFDDDLSHGLGLYVVSMILNKYNFNYDYLADGDHFTFIINF